MAHVRRRRDAFSCMYILFLFGSWHITYLRHTPLCTLSQSVITFNAPSSHSALSSPHHPSFQNTTRPFIQIPSNPQHFPRQPASRLAPLLRRHERHHLPHPPGTSPLPHTLCMDHGDLCPRHRDRMQKLRFRSASRSRSHAYCRIGSA